MAPRSPVNWRRFNHRSRRHLAVGLAVLAGILATPAIADGPGKLIASASDTGEGFVSPSLSREIRRPQRMWAVVTVEPVAAAEFDYHVSCETAHDFDFQDGGQNLIGSAVIRLPRPVRKPRSCDVSVDATYDDFESEAQETVTLELRATKQRR